MLKIFENLSVVVFGVTYWLFNMQAATIALMVWLTLFVILAKIMKEKLTKLQLGTWLVVLALGLATIFFKDDRFIKWKTTIINSILGTVLLFSHFIGDKTILERLVDGKFSAPRIMLRNVNCWIIIYMYVIGALNLFVAYNFSDTFWVNFKLFGLMGCNLLFIAFVFYYLREPLKVFFEAQQKQNQK